MESPQFNAAPKLKVSHTEVNPQDFTESLPADKVSQAIEAHPVDFADIENTLENLDQSPAEQQAKRQKIALEAENAIQSEADEFTSDILRLRTMEGLDEGGAINKVITDLCVKLQTEGAEPTEAGGRALHAYARYLEDTAGAKKDDPATIKKINNMKGIIHTIMEATKLGLGHETVTDNVDMRGMRQTLSKAEKAKPSTTTFERFNTPQASEEVSMFRLEDLQKPPAKKPPNTGATTN